MIVFDLIVIEIRFYTPITNGFVEIGQKIEPKKLKHIVT